MQAATHIHRAMSGKEPPTSTGRYQDEEPNSSERRLRILIVEDEIIIAWTVQSLLEERGHEVLDVASTGERAIALARELQPDLVLMDINLGAGMSGIEAAREICALQKAHIVFVSAYADPDMKEEARRSAPGAVFLTKPVAAEVLERTLETIGVAKH